MPTSPRALTFPISTVAETLRQDVAALQSEGEALCTLLPPADRDALVGLVLSSDAPVPSLLRLVAREQLDDGTFNTKPAALSPKP